MKLTTYDTYDRCFVVMAKDGSKQTFATPWEAEAYALRTHMPQLHQLATSTAAKYPALKSRAWKAAKLAAEGDVNFSPRNEPSLVAEVSSSKPGQWYEVSDGLKCNCPDFTGGGAPVIVAKGKPARMCKHILAVQFAKAAGLTAGEVMDEFGSRKPAMNEYMDVRRFGDGTDCPFSLQRAHNRFMVKHQRPARDRNELGSFIYA